MITKVAILGSTGSIGTQALDVVDNLKDIEVKGLSTNENIGLLEEQVRKYKPDKVAVIDVDRAEEFKIKIGDTFTKVYTGQEGLVEVAQGTDADIVLVSVVGISGLIPTLAAISAGKKIALANKETLVAGGSLVMNKAKELGIPIIPVDSEHSAIFQCLQTGMGNIHLKKIIITASGGPFRGRNEEQLNNVSIDDALNHPTWNMGKKVTIDSATLMNKGLEVIEAKWLFDVDIDKIDVAVHPESIVHSMVEYIDNSVIAQLGMPDMRMPIQYAFTYPNRRCFNGEGLCLFGKKLTFYKPDIDTFKCLRLAYEAIRKGGTAPTVLNAANEIAVEQFLSKKIKFLQIPEIIETVMFRHNNVENPNLDDILSTDKWAREETKITLKGWCLI
jgi:1-deoxy-D-xylulose-5-phosphate reductoisomerase